MTEKGDKIDVAADRLDELASIMTRVANDLRERRTAPKEATPTRSSYARLFWLVCELRDVIHLAASFGVGIPRGLNEMDELYYGDNVPDRTVNRNIPLD